MTIKKQDPKQEKKNQAQGPAMHETKTENVEEQDDSALLTKGANEGTRQAMEMAESARQKKFDNPSFCRQLFMGDFDPSLLYPFPQQSEEDKKVGDEMVEKVRVFLEENLDPDEVDATRTIPQKAIDGMAELGLFAMKVPKKYNGLGFSQVNYNRVLQLVSTYCGSTATLLSAHQSIGVPNPLNLFGTEEQKQKFFPRFREGSISAFALTEPNVGSDPAQMTTTAEISEDGSYYTVNGLKLWCTNGTLADIIVVMTQTAPKIVKGKERKQVSAFIVEMNAPGIEIVHRCDFMGLNAIGNALIKFTNVKIPAENLLWGEGRGLALALATLNTGRLTLPAASGGCAKQCLSIVRRWSKERVQWGQSIGLHENGREKISYIASSTLAIEAITWLTSAWADSGDVDIRIEAAMAKFFCTEELWTITDLTMQLRGGRGYEKSWSLKARGEEGFPVERMMRDCRINTILEGTTEIMKLFLAREAMDPHLKYVLDVMKSKGGEKVSAILKLFAFYATWYPKQWIYGSKSSQYKSMGPLAKHMRYVEKSAHKLARNIFLYMALYQQGLEKKQLILGRLMEIGTDLFAITATCSYATKLANEKNGDKSVISLAEYFCTRTRRRINDRFKMLSDNDDKPSNELAKDILNGDMKWMEEGIMWIGDKE
ncbi:MAG: alkylation response protein AidB-like acyl-CoA dehydrogenase [Chlamydiales bacterium]|jgi:alkylation response protein AidB-like acyl-CoA dehydrogenase